MSCKKLLEGGMSSFHLQDVISLIGFCYLSCKNDSGNREFNFMALL